MASMSKQIESIVALSTQPFDDVGWTNKRQVMTRAARRAPVLFVFTGSSLAGALLAVLKGRMPLPRLFNRLGRPAPGLTTFEPFTTLTGRKLLLVRRLEQRLLAWLIARQARRLGLEHPVLWVYDPEGAYMLGKLGERLSVYDCVDDFKNFPQYRHPARQAWLVRREDELTRRADLVFATAPSLFEARKKLNPNTHYTPNAADADHFAQARAPGLAVHPDVAGLKKPVLGFYGAISGYKVDLELIAHLAQARPDCSIALIGEIGVADADTNTRVLAAPNIHLLGPRPYEELPSLVKGFDVGLIPYRLNRYTHGVFPIKFFELMATGKPVVATALPALEPFLHLAYPARDHEEFIRLVNQALAEQDPQRAAARINAASLHTWDQKTERLIGLIEARLEQKRAP